MRALFAAALLLLFLPAASATVTTEAVDLQDAESCRDATREEPYVFQEQCTRGSIVCSPWFSYWDEQRDRAMSFCTI